MKGGVIHMSNAFDIVPDVYDYDKCLSDPLRTLREYLEGNFFN